MSWPKWEMKCWAVLACHLKTATKNPYSNIMVWLADEYTGCHCCNKRKSSEDGSVHIDGLGSRYLLSLTVDTHTADIGNGFNDTIIEWAHILCHQKKRARYRYLKTESPAIDSNEENTQAKKAKNIDTDKNVVQMTILTIDNGAKHRGV